MEETKMNIKALIKKYEELWNEHSPFHEPVPYTSMVELFLKELKQLDEPQKVKVPQFVAEWIEEARKACKDVAELFEFDFTNDEVRKWFMQERPFDLVARAWLDGYEVEKEKRYFVKIKGNIKGNMLVYGELLKRYFFTKSFSLDDVIYSHTRKQLEEAGLGWVFDCEGIDIDEVRL
ncbi:Phage protein [Streptococcus phage 23782]|uniref:Phage protein n=2 Tax=root TaxID=1 RepID=E8ZDM5_9CAUD|nr:Phage protein [Streptococcus phage 23782]